MDWVASNTAIAAQIHKTLRKDNVRKSGETSFMVMIVQHAIDITPSYAANRPHSAANGLYIAWQASHHAIQQLN
jgi:hypothetical protein